MTFLCKILSNLIMAVALIVATWSVFGFIDMQSKSALAVQAAAHANLVVGGRFDRSELDQAEAEESIANAAASYHAIVGFGAIVVLLLGMIVWLIADWKESAFPPVPSKDPEAVIGEIKERLTQKVEARNRGDAPLTGPEMLRRVHLLLAL